MTLWHADIVMGDPYGDQMQYTPLSINPRAPYEQHTAQVHCAICAKDRELHGEGIFRTPLGQIKKGRGSCGCTSNYKFTEEQYILRLKRYLKSVSCEYVGWAEPYLAARTCTNISCNRCGKPSVAEITTILTDRWHCLGCSGGGFRREHECKLYVLRACSDNGDFTGYGISKLLEGRLQVHRCNLAKRGFRITEMEVFDLNGESALKIEQMVKRTFPTLGQEIEGFRTEATHYWLYDDLIAFVDMKAAEIEEAYRLEGLNKAGVRGFNEITTQEEQQALICT